jgi:RHS repeat-associated protein
VESKLDFAGVVKQSITRHKRLDTDTDKVITENFTYDSQNRLFTHTHQVDNNPVEYLAQNTYNELSQLQTKKVGGANSGSWLQTVDYKYNIRGWMTQINDPNNLGNNLFGYKINYNQIEGLAIPNSDFLDQIVKAKYNGNIAEVSWKTLTEENEPLKRYGYSYDALNRLTAGFYQKSGSETAKEYFEKLEYDLNGNITRLKRSEGLLAGSTTALMIDNLRYDYTGNRLTKVTEEQIGNSKGYPYLPAPNTITYDDNGNMITHLDKGISEISYNFLNLPIIINVNPGSRSTKTLQYTYRADGVKVAKTFYQNSVTNTILYLDGFQYKYSPASTAGSELQFVPTSEGYFDFEKNLYIYNYTDHLGNVRLSYADSNHDGGIQPRDMNVKHCEDLGNGNMACYDVWLPGEVVEINNYYPFGLLHNYLATTANAYQYKYNGKELQENGMYDYGARFYMPDIGRWGVVDPLAETSRRWSPYTYAYNNPVRFIDPDGRQNEDKIKIFNDGKIERTKDNNPYDTVTNEDESKSIQIARVNVSESNPTGDSQIGEAKTVPYEIEGEYGEPSSSEYTYLQINNDAVADSFFEFAADNIQKEFGQDRLSFTDGFTTNIIGTNHSDTTSSSAIDAIGYKEVNTNLLGKHFINQATREERVHNHRAGIGAWGPSGFDVSRNSKTGELLIQKTFLNPVGDRKSYNPSVRNTYQYTPGVGYFKYNKDTATYIGKTKK